MSEMIKMAHRFLHPTLTIVQLHELTNIYNDQRISKASLAPSGEVMAPMVRVRACKDLNTFEVGFVTPGTFQDYFVWSMVPLTKIHPTLRSVRGQVTSDPLLYTSIRGRRRG